MKTTKIAIADSQLLARAGLKHLLLEMPMMEVLFEANNEASLFEQLKQQQADLVVIDYDHPPAFTASSIIRLQDQYPNIKVLVISDDDRRHQIFRLLENGLKGFITKACSEQEVKDALQAITQKDNFFCSKVLDFLLEKSFQPTTPTESSVLTPREQELISLIAKGFVAKEIAERLHLSTHTVYTHRKNILKKLGLRSSSELFLYALQNE